MKKLLLTILVTTLIFGCEKEEETQNPCDCYTLDENAPSNLRSVMMPF